VHEDDGIRRRLRVNFVGTKRGKYDAFITENHLEAHIRYIGYVRHQTGLRYLAESAASFLCQIPVYESATTKLFGKLFEYVYMRKPILALTLPRLTREILSRSRLGTTVDPNDHVGIKKVIYELYGRWSERRPGPAVDEAYIGTFDRVRRAKVLAGLFDRLVEVRA